MNMHDFLSSLLNLFFISFLFIVVLTVIIVTLCVVFSKRKKKKMLMRLDETKRDYLLWLKNQSFSLDKVIEYKGHSFASYKDRFALLIDDTNKKWTFSVYTQSVIYNYVDLLDYELIEDGGSIVSGRTGSAIFGAALLGVAGSVIGASGSRTSRPTCTNLQLRVKVNNLQKPELIYYFIWYQVSKSSPFYSEAFNKAKEIAAALHYILNQVREKKSNDHLIESNHDKDTITCPMCAETIKRQAKRCRFCGHPLTNESNTSMSI